MPRSRPGFTPIPCPAPSALAAAVLSALLSLSVGLAQATTATGSMSVPRMLHQATTMADGRILFSAGIATFSTPTYTSAEIYDPASGLFAPAAPMVQPRTEHGAVALADGRILVMGGSTARSPSLIATNTAEIYDPATGQWSATGNMQAARARVLARALPDGRVFVANQDHYSGTRFAEVFDPQTNSFTRTGDMRDVSGWHGMVVLADGRVMKLGGYVGDYINRVEIWDPATNAWSATGPMLEARQSFSPVLLPDGKVLVAGGSNISTLKTTELYDPATGVFTAGAPMPEFLTVDTSTVLANGNVLLTGPYARNMMHYQSATGTWNVTGPKRVATRLTTVSRLPNGNLLLAGGAQQNDATASAAIWDQACAPQVISVPNAAQSVGGDGGPVSWTVTAAPGCDFEAAALPAWLTRADSAPLEMAASGSMAVSFVAAPNTTGATRSATFMLGNQNATLTQPASPVCPSMPTLSPFYTLRSYATNGVISVTAAASCPWRISALPSFVTATSGVSGTGNGSVNYTVAANPGAARSGTGQIDALSQSSTFTMHQEAAPLCPTAPSLSPTGATLAAAGASGTVTVSAASACPWSVGTLPSWLTLTAGGTGTGNGSFTYAAAANSGAARSANGVVTGPGVASTFTLNQAASPCATWSISPGSATFAAAGATGSLAVTAGTACSWSLGGLPAWMSTTSATSGSGNGSIAYTVAANSGAARNATAVLSGAGPSLSVALAQASALAPVCNKPIGSGVPLNGNLQSSSCGAGARGANYYTDRYTFTSEPGRQVTILVTSAAFDTYVHLRNPAGTVIKSDDDGGGGTNSRIPYGSGSFTLPAGSAGTYTIEVSSYYSYGTGAYSVSFSQ